MLHRSVATSHQPINIFIGLSIFPLPLPPRSRPHSFRHRVSNRRLAAYDPRNILFVIHSSSPSVATIATEMLGGGRVNDNWIILEEKNFEMILSAMRCRKDVDYSRCELDKIIMYCNICCMVIWSIMDQNLNCFTISRLYFIIHHWWIKRYCYFHSLRFVHRYLSIIIGLLLNIKWLKIYRVVIFIGVNSKYFININATTLLFRFVLSLKFNFINWIDD